MNNKTNHTPGPWKIGMRPGPIVYGAKGEQVADLTARLVADDETRGNIRLITAAPDLLACLLDVLDADGDLNVMDFDRYRAAIAKATGTTTPTPNN